jgi:hypothetical protein
MSSVQSLRNGLNSSVRDFADTACIQGRRVQRDSLKRDEQVIPLFRNGIDELAEV